MKWLARLKDQKTQNTGATKPTEPGFVGFVATRPGSIQKIGAAVGAANDGKCQSRDLDRWCWPHSEAMNRAEIDLFNARLFRFTTRGLSLIEGEALVDKLRQRDREQDERRLCLECAHLQGVVRPRCGNHGLAEVPAEGIAPELIKSLQRCAGYKSVVNDGQRGANQ